jgi:hypothetical protein
MSRRGEPGRGVRGAAAGAADAGALLAADPALTAAELAGALADEVRRLEVLRYDDGSGVGAPSVGAAFELVACRW